MSAMASELTAVSIVYPNVYSGALLLKLIYFNLSMDN